MAFVIDCASITQPGSSYRCLSGAFGPFPMQYSSIFGSADGSQQMFDEYSTIVQGTQNIVQQYTGAGNTYGCHNAIINGAKQKICGCYDMIGTGCGSCIMDCGVVTPGPARGWNFMGVGFDSCIVDSYVSFIGGGGAHCISNSYTGVIVGGDHNHICANAPGSFVRRAGILTGACNVITGSDCGTVIGGYGNNVCTNSDFGSIGNGCNNTVSNSSCFGAIGSGFMNVVDNSAVYGYIGGGYFNCISKRKYFYRFSIAIHANFSKEFMVDGEYNYIAVLATTLNNFSNLFKISLN